MTTMNNENERCGRRNSILLMVAGLLLIVLAILKALTIPGRGWEIIAARFFELENFLYVLLPAIGILLISGKRRVLDILRILDKIFVPIGATATLVQLGIVFAMVGTQTTIGAIPASTFMIPMLALIYGLVGKLIVSTIRARIECY